MPAYWLKPEDSVHIDWFAPLEELAREAAADPSLPAINPDDFMYAARIERDGFPTLHAYRHLTSRKFVNVDDNGRVWRYTASDKIGSLRYAPLPNVGAALSAADLFRGNLLMRHLRSAATATATIPPGALKSGRQPGPPGFSRPGFFQTRADARPADVDPAHGDPHGDSADVDAADVVATDVVAADVVAADAVEIDVLDAAYEASGEPVGV